MLILQMGTLVFIIFFDFPIYKCVALNGKDFKYTPILLKLKYHILKLLFLIYYFLLNSEKFRNAWKMNINHQQYKRLEHGCVSNSD